MNTTGGANPTLLAAAQTPAKSDESTSGLALSSTVEKTYQI